MEKEKYLFLYLKTGGGHLAPARSIAQYLSTNHSTVEPVLFDGFTDTPWFVRFIVEDGYRILQAKAKWYYELIYASNKFPPVAYLNIYSLNYFVKPILKKKILEEKPKKIVIFHFLLVVPLYEALRELNLDIPVVTVVTDPFTAHSLWFHKKKQNFVVFSERIQQLLLHKGIPEKNIFIFPFIVDEKFSLPLPQKNISEVKHKFGIAENKKVVLIIGGGDGIPRGKEILLQLLRSNLNIEIVIVAGKNKELYNNALNLQKNYPQLKVFGFVDFVYDLLNASDIVITKCGASTVMEILLMQKIPIIIDYLWEQELGNMEFVRDNKLGIFEKKIKKLPEILRSLIESEEYYNSFVNNIRKMNLRNGTSDVGEFIFNFTLTQNH